MEVDLRAVECGEPPMLLPYEQRVTVTSKVVTAIVCTLLNAQRPSNRIMDPRISPSTRYLRFRSARFPSNHPLLIIFSSSFRFTHFDRPRDVDTTFFSTLPTVVSTKVLRGPPS